jgi:hypothetical protein
MTWATIDGWIEQWYGNAPVREKTKLKLVPEAMGPLSNAPLSDVTVWVTPSFRHVTLVPALTLIAAGLNAKSTIVTALPLVVRTGAGDGEA